MISKWDKLRVAYTIYVRMGLSTIYDLRIRQEAFLHLYETNKERNPQVAKYCAQKHAELMKWLGGEKLERLLGPEMSLR